MKTLISLSILTILSVSSALALSVTNRDKAEHAVTVDKGAVEVVHKVAPGATVTEPCPDVCGVRIADGNGSDFLAKDADKLAITGNRVLPDK
ncbi:MAG: hypothetical protein SGJ17_08970 [Hyphomicrobiales bacterium]|nr:hypothetical protein [Hyphomicrobiales bacterium]MDZ4791321.1 hypothetical protein [Hyphomicrobiales bacterium]